jgi:NADH:ubiquinone oxidoreductase subunit 5 (subunit L)/multisubunit Na+/H+ antiporter MnhA subunit
MPITFISFLVASLAISGVPPLNGFASKWMVLQGVIETAHRGGFLWIVWLIAAMIGSAFTLASFMKILHAVFLGQPSQEEARRIGKKGETSPMMWIPMVVLAFVCLLFGLFASQIPLQKLIFPSMGYEAVIPGNWNSGPAVVLLLVAIFIGFLIYLLGAMTKTRETEAFVGGEKLVEHPEMRVSGTDFYRTIQDMRGLKEIYALAEKRQFDPYDVGIREVSRVTKILKILHNGVLPTYLAWVLLGAAILMIILLV